MGAWIEICTHDCYPDTLLSRTLHGCVDWNSVTKISRYFVLWSHPSWVRGLKYESDVSWLIAEMSHPSWVRGLKFQGNNAHLPMPLCRTLHGCVDWNDVFATAYRQPYRVAPFMGAWIEISMIPVGESVIFSSHPSWVRGLKSSLKTWLLIFCYASHPSWVRGLKWVGASI